MQAGDVVGGRYAIVAPIASGGMGTVYRARHTVSERVVALKVLDAEASTTGPAMARFRQEASAAANIGHRGIVEVLDAGVCETTGQLFIAMELLSGEDLRGVIQRDPQRAFAAVLEALHPLAALHARGFVHRDLKPENLFLSRTPGGAEQVKILDFGIARSTVVHAHTQTGACLGTPGYMAPEQVESARHATAASDVWAVGVMLYEALSGRLPFDGPTSHAVMIAACQQPHEPLTGIDPRLAAVVDGCLAKDPAARPPDANRLRAQLVGIGVMTDAEHGVGGSAAPQARAADAQALAPTIASDAPPGTSGADALAPTIASDAPPDTSSADVEAPTIAATPRQARTTGPVVHTPGPAKAPRRLVPLLVAGLAAVVLTSGALLTIATAPEETLIELESGAFERALENPTPPPEGYRRVKKNDWSLDLPKSWAPSLGQTPPNVQMVAYDPSSKAKVTPRVMVQVDPFDQPLSAYVILGEHNMEAAGATIHERYRDELGILPGAGVDVSFSQSPTPYRMLNRATVVRGRGYHVDCMGAEDDWAELREVCARIVDTFWVNP